MLVHRECRRLDLEAVRRTRQTIQVDAAHMCGEPTGAGNPVATGKTLGLARHRRGGFPLRPRSFGATTYRHLAHWQPAAHDRGPQWLLEQGTHW